MFVPTTWDGNAPIVNWVTYMGSLASRFLRKSQVPIYFGSGPL